MKQFSIVLLGVVMSVCYGCLTPRTDGISVEKGRLQTDNVPFSLNLEMVQDAMYKTPEGFLRVQVTLQNKNREDFDCQYRFMWKDKNGLTLTHAQSSWKPLVLYGKQKTVVEGVAPISAAADFKLAIRASGLR
jgi:uncharacterized protein YcfL